MASFEINRRNFLMALAAGTAHLMINPLTGCANGKHRSINPLQKIKLGKTGIETTLLGFGTGISGFNRSSFLTRQDHQKSIATLLHAYDRGIRFFDMADAYGTHGLMKEALKKMNRDEVTLTSKIWTRKNGVPDEDKLDADVVVERFRKELDTDVIDLVQLHCMVDGKWIDIEKKQMDLLENLKAKGIIRAHGTSVHSLNAMKAAAETDWVDVLHARINPYGVAMDHNDPDIVLNMVRKVYESGKGVIGMKMIGNGKFKTSDEKINNTLKFALGLDIVDMIIVGFESITEIDNYLGRMSKTLKEASNQ